jgi:hypothetical protein
MYFNFPREVDTNFLVEKWPNVRYMARVPPVMEADAGRDDGPCWDRTNDLEIKSLLLYQLS